MAVHHGTQREINFLVDHVERVITRAATSENWRFIHSEKHPQLRLLASIVVEEWLHPAKYWRPRTEGYDEKRPVIGSFTHAMRCDRKTWHNTWKQYFNRFRGHPKLWYERGQARMEVV